MADRFDLVVVGGGFAGLVCARVAAERGLEVAVLERKAEPGAAVHTTGILVKEAAEACPVPEALTRAVRGIRLYGPSLRHIDLDSDGYYFLATDTPAIFFEAEVGGDSRHNETGTTFVEIFSWARPDGPNLAHEMPAVMAIWEPMGALVEDRDGRPGMEFPCYRPLVLDDT